MVLLGGILKIYTLFLEEAFQDNLLFSLSSGITQDNAALHSSALSLVAFLFCPLGEAMRM